MAGVQGWCLLPTHAASPTCHMGAHYNNVGRFYDHFAGNNSLLALAAIAYQVLSLVEFRILAFRPLLHSSSLHERRVD